MDRCVSEASYEGDIVIITQRLLIGLPQWLKLLGFEILGPKRGLLVCEFVDYTPHGSRAVDDPKNNVEHDQDGGRSDRCIQHFAEIAPCGHGWLSQRRDQSQAPSKIEKSHDNGASAPFKNTGLLEIVTPEQIDADSFGFGPFLCYPQIPRGL